MTEEKRSRARITLTIVLLAAVLALAIVRDRPPLGRGKDTPLTEFSAARAEATLRRVLGDGKPHPIGSDANRGVRDRIIAELRTLGLDPLVESGIACFPKGACGYVENIVATIPGTTNDPPLLMNAHYDSVWAGPGAADDATGVACILEAARAIRASTQPRRAVRLLIDDGEEAGLLGAELYGRTHKDEPLALVIVLEARGTSGRAMMFETSRGNGPIISLYAKNVPMPATNSVAFTIYELLPNDTNLTVFKREGRRGMALAFIGDPAQYHTPLDQPDNVSRGSIQHMGDTLLPVAKAVANGEAPGRGANSSYFDLFGWGVVRWPQGATAPLAIVALIMLLASAALDVRRGNATLRGIVSASGLVSGVVVASAGLTWMLLRAWSFHLDGATWSASGALQQVGAGEIALLFVALAGVFSAVRIANRSVRDGVWLLFASVGVALAFALPGTAYLFVLPSLVAGVFALFDKGNSTLANWLSITVPAVVLGAVLFPLLVMLYGALGTGILPAIAAIAAIIFATAMPLIEGERGASRAVFMLSLCVMVAAVLVIVEPVFSTKLPQPINVVYLAIDGEPAARWLAELDGERIPSPLDSAAQWRRETLPSLDIGRKQPAPAAIVAPAPPPGDPFPSIAVEGVEQKGERLRLKLRLVSTRGAGAIRLRISNELNPSLESAGDWVMTKPMDSGVFQFAAVPRDGVVVELGISKPGAGTSIVIDDQSTGIPAEGATLIAARPATASAAHRGDRTVLVRRYDAQALVNAGQSR